MMIVVNAYLGISTEIAPNHFLTPLPLFLCSYLYLHLCYEGSNMHLRGKALPLCLTLTSVLLASCGGDEAPSLVVHETIPAAPVGSADTPATPPPQPASGNAAGSPDEPFVIPPEEQPEPIYPFYMDMEGLLPPRITLHVRCDESMAAGKHVLAEGEKFPWSGYSRGGIELVYQAFDDTGAPCVYPFAPWSPTRGPGDNDWPDGSQFIYRSAVPGHRVVFRSEGEWARLHFKPWSLNERRFHFEMRDIELDFRKAVQAMGALHLEAVPDQTSLLSVVIRRSRLTGAKNAMFIPSGRTMVYIEDSQIGANVGTNVDQEHSTYVNGILSFHAVDSIWFGQKASGSYGGHQLKNYSYLTVLEDVTLDSGGGKGAASNRPLYDGSSYGFTWMNGLTLVRQEAEQPREALIDLRDGHYHKGRKRGRNEADGVVELPWLKVDDWRMPVSDPCSTEAINQTYLHVFRDVTVESFRQEPFVARLNGVYDSYDEIMADPQATRARAFSFGTKGDFDGFLSPTGYRYLDENPPVYTCEDPRGALPDVLADRDAFIRNAFAKVGYSVPSAEAR